MQCLTVSIMRCSSYMTIVYDFGIHVCDFRDYSNAVACHDHVMSFVLHHQEKTMISLVHSTAMKETMLRRREEQQQTVVSIGIEILQPFPSSGSEMLVIAFRSNSLLPVKYADLREDRLQTPVG